MNTPYSAPYIAQMSHSWRIAVMRSIIEKEIRDKKWDIETSILSHTPMSKEAGKHLESRVRYLEKEFEKALRPFLPKKRIDRSKPIVSSYTVIADNENDLGDLGKGLEVKKNAKNRQ
jgi:hypothetical protein